LVSGKTRGKGMILGRIKRNEIEEIEKRKGNRNRVKKPDREKEKSERKV